MINHFKQTGLTIQGQPRGMCAMTLMKTVNDKSGQTDKHEVVYECFISL